MPWQRVGFALGKKKNLQKTRSKYDGTTRSWLPLEVFTGFVFAFCFSVQTVYISDAEMNLAAIKFWGGLKVLTYSSFLCFCFQQDAAERV